MKKLTFLAFALNLVSLHATPLQELPKLREIKCADFSGKWEGRCRVSMMAPDKMGTVFNSIGEVKVGHRETDAFPGAAWDGEMTGGREYELVITQVKCEQIAVKKTDPTNPEFLQEWKLAMGKTLIDDKLEQIDQQTHVDTFQKYYRHRGNWNLGQRGFTAQIGYDATLVKTTNEKEKADLGFTQSVEESLSFSLLQDLLIITEHQHAETILPKDPKNALVDLEHRLCVYKKAK